MKHNKAIATILFAAVLSAVPGCAKQTGSLTGKVMLNGEAIESGQVTLLNEQGETVGTSNIVAGGEYAFTDVPPGAVTLVVRTHRPDGQPIGAPPSVPAPPDRVKNPPQPPGVPKPPTPPPPPPDAPEAPKGPETASEPESGLKAKPVPLKYTNPKDSDLKTSVVKGTVTTFNIEMTGEGQIPKALHLVAPPSEGSPTGGHPGPPVGPRKGGPPDGPRKGGPPAPPPGPPRG